MPQRDMWPLTPCQVHCMVGNIARPLRSLVWALEGAIAGRWQVECWSDGKPEYATYADDVIRFAHHGLQHLEEFFGAEHREALDATVLEVHRVFDMIVAISALAVRIMELSSPGATEGVFAIIEECPVDVASLAGSIRRLAEDLAAEFGPTNGEAWEIRVQGIEVHIEAARPVAEVAHA